MRDEKELINQLQPPREYDPVSYRVTRLLWAIFAEDPDFREIFRLAADLRDFLFQNRPPSP